MAIRVFKVLTCVDGILVRNGLEGQGRAEVIGMLTAMGEHPDQDGPAWSLELVAERVGLTVRTLTLPLEKFLSADEHRQSRESPVRFDSLATYPIAEESSTTAGAKCVWLYRDAFYVTERAAKKSEHEEVALRIKTLHFQDELALKRLREQVANFEAIERGAGEGAGRQPIPDDVKLLVWSRDGGACVRCHATTDLHFDHIIPLSRGGGDHAENIQLLCRSCNLKKGSRLV